MGRAQTVLDRLLARDAIPTPGEPRPEPERDTDDPTSDDLIAHVDGNLAEIRFRSAGQVVGRAAEATWD